jgi:Ser/Thr protein kinase RdoA (MazF antagonist)
MIAAIEDPEPGRLTRTTLDALLATIGKQAGLDVRDAQLIKFTNNAVFRLAHEPVVVRIAGSETMRVRIPKVVEVARWLAEHDAPAVRLLNGVPQPLQLDGQLVTLWQAVPLGGPPPNGADLARILRLFHGLPAPAPSLPNWRPFDEIRSRLAEPEGLDDANLAYLLEECDRVEAELADVSYVLPRGPIHGDAFLGNLIPSPDGPVICDFDSSADGPREWDLTPVAVGRLRFDYPGDAHGELAAGYGFDVLNWPGFPVLRQIRELKLVTSVIPILKSNPRLREQWAFRLRTFRERDVAAKWSTYS